MVIPEFYTKTSRDKPFLLHDSNDGKDRFLMFSTKRNLKFLKSCLIWQADGTFKCVPSIFAQLYTIHGISKNKTVPLIYLLLPNKNKKTYQKALDVIKTMIRNYSPEEIILDFEPAFFKTFHKMFPQCRLKGCLFHFSDCVWRHVQEFGLQKLYSEDIAFMSSVKMLIALSFVPSEDVIYAYEILISSRYFVQNEELFNNLLNYFENTWIGSKRRNNDRKKPLFDIDMWNNFNDVINNLPRTNNAVEGWHNAFSGRVGKHHAEMNEFINCLKLEQNSTELTINHLKTGADVAGPKRKKYKNYDERLANVVNQYNRNDVIEYLRNVAVLIVI